jgi:imidazolonepropionase
MSSGATLVVRNIGELATCDPSRGESPGLLIGAALAAEGDRLVYVGDDGGLRGIDISADADVVDAGGNAVIPGLVDAHTHAVFAGHRGGEYALRAEGISYEEIAALGGGIRATVRATRQASVDELVALARPRLRRMRRSGTTTVEIKSGYGLELDTELRQLQAAHALGRDASLPDVAATFLPLHAAPDGERAAFVEEVCRDWLPQAAPQARFVDAFCESGVFTVTECETLYAAARDLGLGVKVHAEQRTHSGGAALAARSGAVSADHLEHADDNDLRALAAAGTVGVLLPGAALTLGGPPPPGRRLIDAGAQVAVATDCNPGTCYTESMPLMISLAVSIAGLRPAEALVAATSGGAAALALPDRGVLAAGMRCDLLILDSPNWIDIAYHFGGCATATVVIGGRRIED